MVVVDGGVGLLHRSVAQEETKMIIYFVGFGVYSPRLSPHTLLLKLSNDACE